MAAGSALCQLLEGDLRVAVRDSGGQAVRATVRIEMRAPDFQAQQVAEHDGVAKFRRLPLGIATVSVAYPGFGTHSQLVEIRSSVPVEVAVLLTLLEVRSEVMVEAQAPLLDPLQPGMILQAGRRQLAESPGSLLGREVTDVITSLPGWLLEANAVLHPRGSEYDTQYVIDGMPLYDNRSLAFAPAFLRSEFNSVSVLTGGIPAEFGRRMGGVIALDTRRQEPGVEVNLQGGNYGTVAGTLASYGSKDRTAWTAAVHGGATDRYLDPPSLENFTNASTTAGFHARLDQDFGDRDRFALYLRSNRTGFMVPNDPEQQEEGQRQDRRAAETAGQVHWQRSISSSALATVRGMFRDVDARLWSNAFSTPVNVLSDRGLRESNVIGTVSFDGEHHSVKAGGDIRLSRLRESFRFDRGSLSERGSATESSAFVQDHFRLGNLAVAAGIRFDYYNLLIRDTAWSPRVALSYYVPAASLLLRGSYDRVFQPPPSENLLVSSAAGRLSLGEFEGALAVPPTRGNFYEVGLRKAFRDVWRVDVTHYWRTFRNFADDDVFLNTGLSFPITFDTARVQGTEVRLELPPWRGFTSYLSWSNMHGSATAPVTGGLFLEGGEAEELRDSGERFPITQDQRNTVAAQVRFSPARGFWVAGGLRYGSGLPFEADDDGEDDDGDDDDDGVPQAILDQIDFSRGRIRPNRSIDVGMALLLWDRGTRNAWLQFDARNLEDRLNIVNFSGLFSGTAIAPGRQISVQLRVRF